MAPTMYRELPFALITTPTSQLPIGTKADQFYRCASEMACIHNMMIRGLNSIYLQAPYVKKEDVKSFLLYSACFYDLVSVHHKGEEDDLFPKIEQMAGENGIMQHNIEQHHAFHDGLQEYHRYITHCLSDTQQFSGKKLITIIDAFGRSLVEHLTAEITTILELAEYGDRMRKLETTFEAWAEKDILSVPGTLTWGFFNHDKEYEEGLWKDWPPAPTVVVFAVRHVTYWIHSDWWKFASCDPQGRPRANLYALP
ncbi:hemerythrin HHE cation binding domain-containing protein [Trichoderma velutinum]